MIFIRSGLADSARELANSTEIHERSIGFNYLVEENVGDARRDEVEAFDTTSDDVREVVQSYFDGSIQGLSRGHPSSTFDESLNEIALLPVTVEPNQKIIRLERIDRLIPKDPALTFDRLSEALARPDDDVLQSFIDLFLTYPGERPSFCAFKSEVDDDLRQADWLQRLIDRMGLYHHYPFDSSQTYSFALMEYTAKDVFDQAGAKGMNKPFAIATVLECQDNPAFFPVPRGTSHGFTVDLRERDPRRPSVREILHIRFDYGWRHLSRFEQWGGRDLPDLASSRDRHLAMLRNDTGRPDFGNITV